MTEPLVRLESAAKVYGRGPSRVAAVREATISVHSGTTIGIVGPTGSGKTTLLNLMGALLTPTSGEAFFEEKKLTSLMPSERRKIRLARVGFVFQQLKLIETLSVEENIRLPLVLSGTRHEVQAERVAELVRSVELVGKENRRPDQLSVGEQQRVAVARALVNKPALVLADEPTSQLDSASGKRVLELLTALCRGVGAAVVISTHDQVIRDRLGKIYGMRDGVLSPS